MTTLPALTVRYMYRYRPSPFQKQGPEWPRFGSKPKDPQHRYGIKLRKRKHSTQEHALACYVFVYSTAAQFSQFHRRYVCCVNTLGERYQHNRYRYTYRTSPFQKQGPPWARFGSKPNDPQHRYGIKLSKPKHSGKNSTVLTVS